MKKLYSIYVVTGEVFYWSILRVWVVISRILRQALNWPKVADGTGEGFLARMDPHVLLKASLIVEFLIAHGAGMDELALVLVLAHAPLVPIPVHR